VPNRLRLAGSGRAGDERVPVQRGERDPERADPPVLAVQDRAEIDGCLAPGIAVGRTSDAM